jgi:hypothetical protein
MSVNNKSYLSLLFGISLGLIALVAPVVTHAQPADPTSYGMTSGRLVASLSAVVGLIGVVIGLLALFRPAGRFGTASGPLGALVALAAGLIAAVIGGLKAVTASGIGTGGGLAGAIVAVVLGLIAIVLGGLALVRSRRTA